MSKEWELLTKEEKQGYINERNELLEKFKKDLKEWEAKMMLEGHMKLVDDSELDKLRKRIKKVSTAKPYKTRLKEKLEKLYPSTEFLTGTKMKSFIEKIESSNKKKT